VRVVVDALAASTGGGITYLRSLLLAALAADEELELSLAVANAAPFAELAVDPRVEVVCPLGDLPRLPRRLAWELALLGRYAARLRADVVFAPSEVAPLVTRVPLVVGFQNPNLYERPVPYASALAEARLRALARVARNSASRAAALVFVSDAFRQRAVAALGSVRATQHVIEPGLDPVFMQARRELHSFDALRPYVLSVSDFYPYKNFPLLIEAFHRLGRPSLRLVIAGRPVDRHSYRQTVERVRARGIENRVTLLGPVPLVDMPSLYAGADCFVFPSLLESYGFPPLEAMACGVPVVSSNASVMPAVLGDAAAYVDARDVTVIAEAVARVLDDPEWADELRRRGRARVARLDPHASAAALLAAFHAAAATR
jgi:glycosyltransferase involved in cell wall biosynthesis